MLKIVACHFFADPVLQYLFTGLQHNQLATVAAESLQAICSQCPEQMTAHFGALLQIVQAIDSFDVANDAAIGLLKGTGC
jgi:transportin-3